MLSLIVNFLREVVVTVLNLTVSVFDFGFGLLSWLHVEAPRLEGLLIGVTLAWIMTRRNNHPLLRVLSAPLKLIVDILDLAWDQVVEVISDLWDTGKGWVLNTLGWCRDRVVSVWNLVIGSLTKARDLLRKSNDE